MNETKNINCVWDLKLLNNVKENTPVRCQMPDGTKRDVTYQYYVEDGNCYFFISNKEVKGYDGTSNVYAVLEDINVEVRTTAGMATDMMIFLKVATVFMTAPFILQNLRIRMQISEMFMIL